MKRLAVFGNPVAHSLSPAIHHAFADQAGMELTYEKVLVPEGEFAKTARSFFQESGLGCNVTLPCKRDAFNFVDEASRAAQRAGAVNTISRTPEGRFRGDNTDGPGLVADLHRLGWQLENRRLLILGAGGAVSGVLGSLLAESPELVHLHNRTPERAAELATRFAGQLDALGKEDLLSGYDLIINGTSAGIAGGMVDLPASVIADAACCYDLAYADAARPFLDWAEASGARARADGLGMLVEQAALAFRIWFGQEVSTRPVIEKLFFQLSG